MQLLTRSLAALGLLLGLVVLVPLGATAQEGPAPTVGDIVIDSFDCETGTLQFHVYVTDLPHIPDANGPMGASVTGHYEQGQYWYPPLYFNPEPEDAPYTGDVAMSAHVSVSGEASPSPESASGALTHVGIRVGLLGVGSGGSTDESTITYAVDCSGTAPTPPSDGELPLPTVGDIVIDSYDCETGALEFHVYVTDLPHIPDSNGSLGFSIVGLYSQGPESEYPGSGYNVPPADSPYTGDLHFTSTMPPTNEVFIHEGSDEPVGTLETIEISLGVGYGTGGGPSDTTSIAWPVDCGGNVVPTEPPVDPEPTEPTDPDGGDTGDGSGEPNSSDDDESGAEGSAGSDSGEDATGSGGIGGGDAGGVTTLPSTGAGPAAGAGTFPALLAATGAVAALLGGVALRPGVAAAVARRAR